MKEESRVQHFAWKAIDRLQAALSILLCALCVGTAALLLWQLNWNKSKPLSNVQHQASISSLSEFSKDPGSLSIALDGERDDASSSRATMPSLLGVRLKVESQRILDTPVLELRLLTADAARFWAWNASKNVFQPLAVDILDSRSSILIHLPHGITSAEVIGEVRTFAKWKPKVFVWASAENASIDRDFDRAGGALVGAFTLLAAFSLAIGLLNRDLTFLVFAAWLLTSLRVAGLNAGWDLFWLGIEVDSQSLLLAQRASLAIHAFLTLTLFKLVFFRGLERFATRAVTLALGCVYLALLAASPALDQEQFSKLFWPTAGIGLVFILGSVLVRFYKTPDRILFWYVLSWLALAAGLISEILYQANSAAFVNAGVNAQSGAVVAALMMGLALADRLKTEKDARMAAQNSQVETLKQLRDYFEASPIGLFRAGSKGELLLANQAFWKIVGHESNSDSQSLRAILGAGEDDFEKVLSGATIELEIHADGPDESSSWLLVSTKQSNGFLEGQLQDVTSRKLAESTLQYLVKHDSLTGVGNRRGLDEAFSNLFSQPELVDRSSIANLAIDRFKAVNDLYGFRAGDQLLREVAKRIRAAIRPTDYVARLGDTFILLLTGCSPEQSRSLCERVRREIVGEPFGLGTVSLQLTASVGVVQLAGGATANTAFTAAAHAWSDAKALGRNKVVLVDIAEQSVSKRMAELQIVSKLNTSLLDDELTLAMQPIVGFNAKSSQIAFEVLLRKKAKTLGEDTSPGGFLQAAERSGFMSRVDLWVISNSLAWLKKNSDVLNSISFCTINVSGASINDSEFSRALDTLLRNAGCDLRKVCFEITEGVALNNITVTRRFIQLVKFYGCKLALDDFGAGYTSFSSLKDIPADFIKIDGNFVRDIASDPSNFAITRTIVSLTHQLGMLSIAEWAETQECVEALEILGVDYGQGFFLGTPISADEMAVSIASRTIEAQSINA